jgi:hypothetical protein
MVNPIPSSEQTLHHRATSQVAQPTDGIKERYFLDKTVKKCIHIDWAETLQNPSLAMVDVRRITITE